MMILTQNLINSEEIYNFYTNKTRIPALTFFAHLKTTILEEVDQISEKIITAKQLTSTSKKFIEYEFIYDHNHGDIVLKYIGLSCEMSVEKARLSKFEIARYLSKHIVNKLGINPDFIDDTFQVVSYSGFTNLVDEKEIALENFRFDVADLIPSYGLEGGLLVTLSDFNLFNSIQNKSPTLIYSTFKNNWVKNGGEMTAFISLDTKNKLYCGAIKYNIFSYTHLREIIGIKLAQ